MNLNDPSSTNDHIRYDIWMLAKDLTPENKTELERLSEDDKYKCCYSHVGPDVSWFFKYFTRGKYVAFRNI